MRFLNIGKDESKSLTKSKIVEVTFIKNIDEIDITNVQGKVEEETQKVLVKKAPLGKYEELSNLLDKFFNLFTEFLKEQGVKDPNKYIEKMDFEDMIKVFPEFISGLVKFAVDEIIEFIHIGTGIDEDFIRKLDAQETYEIIKAIIQVNGLVEVGKEVKNLIILPKPINEWIGRNFSKN